MKARSTYALAGSLLALAGLLGCGARWHSTEQAVASLQADRTPLWTGTGAPQSGGCSVAWLSDTQYYAQDYPELFQSMTQWMSDAQDAGTLCYAVHTGDIVDDYDQPAQWENAAAALDVLHSSGLPFGVLAGNHDVGHEKLLWEEYTRWFPPAYFQDNGVYGGVCGNSRGHYDLVDCESQQLLFVYLDWGFSRRELKWAEEVLSQYPQRTAVVCTHRGIKASGAPTAASRQLLTLAQDHTNVRLVLSGHYHGSGLNVSAFDDDGDGELDRRVYQLCTDYQYEENGGNGYLRLLWFQGNRIFVGSYSPVLEEWNCYDAPIVYDPAAGTSVGTVDACVLLLD